jgi:hypothetical protein
MKSLREKMSITKLVFLILALVLAFNTIWNTVHWLDNQIFETIISMTFSFYFAQKGLTYTTPDSLMKKDDLTTDEWKDGQPL